MINYWNKFLNYEQQRLKKGKRKNSKKKTQCGENMKRKITLRNMKRNTMKRKMKEENIKRNIMKQKMSKGNIKTHYKTKNE